MAITVPPALTAVLSKIPDLQNGNWLKWSKGMKLFFFGVGAEFVCTGVTPEATDIVKASLDRQMLPYMYGKVSEEYQYLVEDGSSAAAVWKELKGQFEKVSMSNRISARTELYAVEHDPSRDIAVYLHDVATRVARLTALGITVPELEQKDVILMRLHPSFHTARAVIVTTAEEPDLAGVKDLLLTSAASDPSVTVKSEPADLAMAARLKPGSNPFQGSIGPHGFPQDNEGHRWCDPTNKNCHRCGHSGHIAAKCMYSMPQFVKDWILRNSNSSSPSAALAAALAAGLTPESFSDHYHRHVGTSGHAKSARVTESASFAAGAGVNYPASWNEGDDEDSESWDEADELNRYLAAAAAPTRAARATTSSAKSRSSRIILHT